ncbi:selenocysteine lyase [Exophiala viscosa]|uniref:Molybdenum cofactor sulfurase n=1 Tax=Exophiala viscosa TaxID=2486360 RepID=A0AAN6IDV2_9EURO|nr:selenocysteine lyase [Exophiala viscosa]
MATIDPDTGLITNIDKVREAEYPSLASTTYLDHAGTTLYAKSLIDAYSRELTQNLFGNPHSASASSQLSSRRIDDVRLQVLRFFSADPDSFDVVFVANATAAIKLVADAFRDNDNGFRYQYHIDSHTSLIGVRELASRSSTCLNGDGEVEDWLSGLEHPNANSNGDLSLFAYPAQSNMTGRRLPLQWNQRILHARKSYSQPVYTLLDAAALVSTAALDLSDASTAPDFTAVSFYKIFGFPPLGALIVRKDSAKVLLQRRYFGGGTVDMVTVSGDAWHATKETSLHSRLEDGTLPFTNIVALQLAMEQHKRLYGSMSRVSRHASYLADTLRAQLRDLRHANGHQLCTIYNNGLLQDARQGPVIAFNLRDSDGKYISNSEVEKLGIVKNIQFRTGQLCNPGGVATHIGLSPDELRRNYAAGHRCGDDNDVLQGKPTGVIRVSLGAMSSPKDVTDFVDLLKEFYVDLNPIQSSTTEPVGNLSAAPQVNKFIVESLAVFPIKSCAAYKIPPGVSWDVGVKGLAWDREWCLVHQGTNIAMSQKRFPRMALVRPEVDLQRYVLRLTAELDSTRVRKLEVSLDSKPRSMSSINTCESTTNKSSNVCGEDVDVHVYTSPEVAGFFTDVLGVPCTLARFPGHGTIRQVRVRIPGTGKDATKVGRSIALANESPILLVSRSSVNRLNEQIKHNGGVGKAVAADSFRGNIVIAEDPGAGQFENPYAEDDWTGLQIGDEVNNTFEMLGPCQRCQMVCVDQKSAKRRQEPFSTLAKTRRKDGRVWFGMHMCLGLQEMTAISIQVGDRVTPYFGL